MPSGVGTLAHCLILGRDIASRWGVILPPEKSVQYCTVSRLVLLVRLRTVQRCIMFAEKGSWQERYMQTILEVSGQKMPERITATRQAIAGRLHDLEHDSDHHAERHQIENALKALSQLEVETQHW
jgi:hypothetical protein